MFILCFFRTHHQRYYKDHTFNLPSGPDCLLINRQLSQTFSIGGPAEVQFVFFPCFWLFSFFLTFADFWHSPFKMLKLWVVSYFKIFVLIVRENNRKTFYCNKNQWLFPVPTNFHHFVELHIITPGLKLPNEVQCSDAFLESKRTSITEVFCENS